jgi:hypothetical protein
MIWLILWITVTIYGLVGLSLVLRCGLRSLWELWPPGPEPIDALERRPADAGEQFRLLRPSAAAVVPHSVEDVVDQHVGASLHVHLVDHPHLAAAIALDPEEPRREGVERLVEGLLGTVTMERTSCSQGIPATDYLGGWE